MAQRLARVEARGVTYVADDFPVFWSEAKGSNVRDADGNEYVDLTGAFGVAAAGHGHPRIIEAVRRQTGRLVHGMGDVHPPTVKVELLERLARLMPWPESRGILASAGSESVEIALKTAQLVTGRAGVVAFQGGYHGLTLGALSVTAREDFRGPFRSRLPDSVSFVPFPIPLRDGVEAVAGSLEALEAALGGVRPGADGPGAVILEPIQGRGGVRLPPAGFLRDVARITRRAGALLILDEVFTGFGRTGSLFACESEGVVPDLLCVGKALGGGLPLSGCFGSEEVMRAWPASEGEALHTSTFLGHPLSCASALAFLEVLESEGLVARSRREGDRFRDRLAESLSGLPQVAEVRGRGMFVGVELRRAGAGARVAVEALKKGLLLLPAGEAGEIVEIAAPLTISRVQLDWAGDVLAEVVAQAV